MRTPHNKCQKMNLMGRNVLHKLYNNTFTYEDVREALLKNHEARDRRVRKLFKSKETSKTPPLYMRHQQADNGGPILYSMSEDEMVHLVHPSAVSVLSLPFLQKKKLLPCSPYSRDLFSFIYKLEDIFEHYVLAMLIFADSKNVMDELIISCYSSVVRKLPRNNTQALLRDDAEEIENTVETDSFQECIRDVMKIVINVIIPRLKFNEISKQIKKHFTESLLYDLAFGVVPIVIAQRCKANISEIVRDNYQRSMQASDANHKPPRQSLEYYVVSKLKAYRSLIGLMMSDIRVLNLLDFQNEYILTYQNGKYKCSKIRDKSSRGQPEVNETCLLHIRCPDRRSAPIGNTFFHTDFMSLMYSELYWSYSVRLNDSLKMKNMKKTRLVVSSKLNSTLQKELDAKNHLNENPSAFTNEKLKRQMHESTRELHSALQTIHGKLKSQQRATETPLQTHDARDSRGSDFVAKSLDLIELISKTTNSAVDVNESIVPIDSQTAISSTLQAKESTPISDKIKKRFDTHRIAVGDITDKRGEKPDRVRHMTQVFQHPDILSGRQMRTHSKDANDITHSHAAELAKTERELQMHNKIQLLKKQTRLVTKLLSEVSVFSADMQVLEKSNNLLEHQVKVLESDKKQMEKRLNIEMQRTRNCETLLQRLNMIIESLYNMNTSNLEDINRLRDAHNRLIPNYAVQQSCDTNNLTATRNKDAMIESVKNVVNRVNFSRHIKNFVEDLTETIMRSNHGDIDNSSFISVSLEEGAQFSRRELSIETKCLARIAETSYSAFAQMLEECGVFTIPLHPSTIAKSEYELEQQNAPIPFSWLEDTIRPPLHRRKPSEHIEFSKSSTPLRRQCKSDAFESHGVKWLETDQLSIIDINPKTDDMEKYVQSHLINSEHSTLASSIFEHNIVNCQFPVQANIEQGNERLAQMWQSVLSNVFFITKNSATFQFSEHGQKLSSHVTRETIDILMRNFLELFLPTRVLDDCHELVVDALLNVFVVDVVTASSHTRHQSNIISVIRQVIEARLKSIS